MVGGLCRLNVIAYHALLQWSGVAVQHSSGMMQAAAVLRRWRLLAITRMVVPRLCCSCAVGMGPRRPAAGRNDGLYLVQRARQIRLAMVSLSGRGSAVVAALISSLTWSTARTGGGESAQAHPGSTNKRLRCQSAAPGRDCTEYARTCSSTAQRLGGWT